MSFTFMILEPPSELTDELVRALSDELPAAEVVVAVSKEQALAVAGRAAAAFGTVEPDVLAAAPGLAWLQTPLAAPPEGFYYPELVRHPVVVTNMRGIYNDRISAHILACVLGLARGLPVYQQRQFEHVWDRDHRPPTTELAGSTALIVGVGEIGAETARLCSCFGIRVFGVDPRRTEPPAGVESISRPEELDALLPQADFVIVTAPQTPRNAGMFNADRFRLMKPTSYFINVGRGMTTKLDDLTTALGDGLIRGAAIDVYEIEPLPQEHPLWTAANTILTPHIASAGPSLTDRRVRVTLDNARRFAAGLPLLNVVDKAEWY